MIPSAGLALLPTLLSAVAGTLPGSEHPKVRAAWVHKQKALQAIFDKKGVPFPAPHLLIRVFKAEGVLELWGEPAPGAQYVLVRSYPICRSSGELGPKRREGDEQVPEGFYRVTVFNPNSAYHLSLGIDYPNLSDRILGKGGPLGGAIMIHGNCVTIGCVPITDDGIEEVYLAALATHARGGEEIPVEIFPNRLTADGLDEISRVRPELRGFWSNLATGYDYFEKNRRPPRVHVGADGSYRFAR
jgi:murein L,D-transpeptidase YafK